MLSKVSKFFLVVAALSAALFAAECAVRVTVKHSYKVDSSFDPSQVSPKMGQ